MNKTKDSNSTADTGKKIPGSIVFIKLRPWMLILCGVLLCVAAVMFFSDRSGDSVTVRSNPFYFLPVGGISLCLVYATFTKGQAVAIPAPVPFAIIIKTVSSFLLLRKTWWQKAAAPFVGICGIISLILPFAHSATVDANGIAEIFLIDMSTFAPWDWVSKVDYRMSDSGKHRDEFFHIHYSKSIIKGKIKGRHIQGARNSKGSIGIDVGSRFYGMVTINHKEALKIVAKNVPSDRFTDSAKMKLADMGIVPSHSFGKVNENGKTKEIEHKLRCEKDEFYFYLYGNDADFKRNDICGELDNI